MKPSEQYWNKNSLETGVPEYQRTILTVNKEIYDQLISLEAKIETCKVCNACCNGEIELVKNLLEMYLNKYKALVKIHGLTTEI